MTDEPRPPLGIDAYDGDWIKRGDFDLANHGIDSVEKLRSYLTAVGMSVEHFKTLPVYRANVERIGWLREL